MFTNKTPWIILLLFWMGGSTWWHVCQIKQRCEGDAPALTTAALPMVAGLSLIDGDQLNMSLPTTFSFAKSGVVANAGAVGNSLETLATYLIKHPTRLTTITGHYRTEETNPSAFANLGVARAEGIKALLAALGVPAAQLATAGLLADGTNTVMAYNAAADSLSGGLTFAFGGAATTADTLVAKPDADRALAEKQTFTSVFKPIDLYFKSGQAGYIETEATRTFFAEAATYLNTNKGKKLLLTGHTDDQGADKVNLELSEARAKTVKKSLLKAGIDQKQIGVEAKGETQPKESNETMDGRKANRRVTAVVQ